MRITDVNNTNFGYKHPLKTMWLKGDFKKVKYGFYGDRLTKDNISLEHLKAHSKGGKTELSNLVLASKQNNQKRGNKDIREFLTVENVTRYLTQFKNIKLTGFDGNKYIAMVLATIGDLIS
jgi:hypothetical protein